jgi:cardiolipin synthase
MRATAKARRGKRAAGWSATARCWWIVPAALLSGCQVPAARFPATEPGSLPCASALLARQLVEDTAVTVACHPLETSLKLVAVPPARLWDVGRGAVEKRVLTPLCSAPCLLSPEVEGTQRPDEDSYLDDHDTRCLHPAHVALYPDGPSALAALHGLIDMATCRIDVLMYQWENDALGAAIAEHLAARAGPHLRVRVLVDGGGNLIFGCPCRGKDRDVNRVVWDLARKPYVDVIRIRNPFARFDHRKLVVVDGRAAWTGGRNFTKQSFEEFHDISLVVDGPLAGELEDSFDRYWKEQGGTSYPRLARPEAPCADSPPPNALARLMQTEPFHPEIRHSLYHAVDHARRHVYVENFTFGDSRLVAKLASARCRGVDVRVVLTLSCCSNNVNHTSRVIANRLLAAGVRVYIYPGMTHVKAAAVDGCWAYVGTANFDPLSLRHNRELGLAVVAGPLIADIEACLFAPDFCPDWELRAPLPVSTCDYLWEVVSSVCL